MTGMRVLIGTMIKSVPMIANVLLFCVFFFTIFGIFGLQVFMGVLRNRCFTAGDQSGPPPLHTTPHSFLFTSIRSSCVSIRVRALHCGADA